MHTAAIIKSRIVILFSFEAKLNAAVIYTSNVSSNDNRPTLIYACWRSQEGFFGVLLLLLMSTMLLHREVSNLIGSEDARCASAISDLRPGRATFAFVCDEMSIFLSTGSSYLLQDILVYSGGHLQTHNVSWSLWDKYLKSWTISLPDIFKGIVRINIFYCYVSYH